MQSLQSNCHLHFSHSIKCYSSAGVHKNWRPAGLWCEIREVKSFWSTQNACFAFQERSCTLQGTPVSNVRQYLWWYSYLRNVFVEDKKITLLFFTSVMVGAIRHMPHVIVCDMRYALCVTFSTSVLTITVILNTHDKNTRQTARHPTSKFKLIHSGVEAGTSVQYVLLFVCCWEFNNVFVCYSSTWFEELPNSYHIHYWKYVNVCHTSISFIRL